MEAVGEDMSHKMSGLEARQYGMPIGFVCEGKGLPCAGRAHHIVDRHGLALLEGHTSADLGVGPLQTIATSGEGQ